MSAAPRTVRTEPSLHTAIRPAKARGRTWAGAGIAGALTVVLALAGCTVPGEAPGSGSPAASSAAAPGRVQLNTGAAEPEVIAGSDAEASLAASRALFASSPVAFVAAADDAKALAAAEAESVPLGVPLLLAGDGLESELVRLGVRQVKVFGQPPAEPAASPSSAPEEASSGTPDVGSSATASASASAAAASAAVAGTGSDGGITGWAVLLPRVEVLPPDGELDLPDGAAEPADASILIDRDGEQDYPATLAVAEAAGARVFQDPKADPRQSSATIDFLRAEPERRVLGIGKAFGTDDTFGRRVQAALDVPELPGGGQLAFPSRRMVALYGHPAGPALGALGEQGIKESVRRAKKLAKSYQPHSKEPVVPAFEIIATIASASAGKDGDYSAETDVDELRPWVDAAGKAGVYVVLDLQPGRSDFLEQAKLYADLLKEPHVGLALDPEWRLGKGERHMEQIGSVSAAEINKVSDWLADLTRKNSLPQKVLILHQFQYRMISDRQKLETGHPELALVLHADGHGNPGQKLETWRALRQDLPKGIRMGWKNFYDEDTPTFSPERTYTEVDPAPWFVSYQ
ncbi:hypothetical protein [Arthrobacter sulfonylureivorans]|uniref:Cell wall-binding repeat 2 family protein n=1 Tax=Arthrobacter sulfonylureivorans TaxID=2486855 RepID=A0ABY3W926_9MICC|nr:hypothetical protein [Arthrobacter sulfonylureivorans]UNK44822.1 hypothetical protein MNQ99_12720 [Arthrobacter sulfonylureivorans]